MKKTDIKHVIGKLEPDKEMEYRLSKRMMSNQHNKFAFKPIVSIAASLVMFICFGILGYHFIEKKPDTPAKIIDPTASIPAKIIDSTTGINVSKVELPKNTNLAMDMIGLIVYQNRVYTQCDTKLPPEYAENLLGEKLGTTKGNIDEWSQQSDYAVEFASTIGKQEVYSVKGYDKNFRIMTYEKIDGATYSQFYECFNGITVKTGADVFNKLKIDSGTKAAKYETFESYYNSKQQYKEITNHDTLNNFVNELKNTIPYTQESLSSLFSDKGETNQKLVYITLNDNTEIQLLLFKDGYIYYSHIFFKMENQIFNKLWNEFK